MDRIIPIIITTFDGKSERALLVDSSNQIEFIDPDDAEANLDWLERWYNCARDELVETLIKYDALRRFNRQEMRKIKELTDENIKHRFEEGRSF